MGAEAMLAGMAVGAAVLVALWWTAAVAWTWYAFVGAATTSLVAHLLSRFRPVPSS